MTRDHDDRPLRELLAGRRFGRCFTEAVLTSVFFDRSPRTIRQMDRVQFQRELHLVLGVGPKSRTVILDLLSQFDDCF